MEQPELERELRALTQRVAAIESQLGIEAFRDALQSSRETPGIVVPVDADPKDILGALGRALLGVAGAYLLRALTESGNLPASAGVAVGILYAIAWLILAARTPAQRRISAALHSLTAVLVLAPLLWEATLRFHAISTWTSSAILLCFTVFGLAISWRKNLLIVATIATLAGVGTASAMLVASRDVVPFTFVLLAIAAAVEASSCLDHWLNERWLAAIAADLAVLLATWLVTNERGLPEAYAPIPHAALLAAQASLLAVYLASTIVRTLLRHVTFTAFEIAQCAAAFLISVGGGVRLSPAMAAVLVACGAACYVVSFAVIERTGHGRNFYTYSTFGILLTLAGSRILLTGPTAAAIWSLLAIACMWAGNFTLQFHGGVYLLVALAGSGVLREVTTFILGSGTLPGERPIFLAAGAFAAVVCYIRTRHSTLFRLIMAALPAWLLAGIAAGAVTAAYHTAFGDHVYCATLRTGVVAIASVLLAWGGARFGIVEFSHLIYPAMLLGAYRLVMIDLREDHKTALVISLMLYGTALIAVPKLARR